MSVLSIERQQQRCKTVRMSISQSLVNIFALPCSLPLRPPVARKDSHARGTRNRHRRCCRRRTHRRWWQRVSLQNPRWRKQARQLCRRPAAVGRPPRHGGLSGRTARSSSSTRWRSTHTLCRTCSRFSTARLSSSSCLSASSGMCHPALARPLLAVPATRPACPPKEGGAYCPPAPTRARCPATAAARAGHLPSPPPLRQ